MFWIGLATGWAAVWLQIKLPGFCRRKHWAKVDKRLEFIQDLQSTAINYKDVGELKEAQAYLDEAKKLTEELKNDLGWKE